MKLTRKDIITLNHILATTSFDMPIKSQFRYVVSKNLKSTKEEIDEINLAFPTPEGFNEYKEKEKNIYGKYKVENDIDYKNLPDESKKSLDEEITKFREENKELIKELDQLEKEKDSFLNETVDIPIVKIKVDMVPDISQKNEYSGWEIWRTLELIIDDEDESGET